jgi:hypothetical protein
MTDIAAAAQAMLKSAETIENNEGQTVPGTNPIQPQPADRGGAMWGDKPTKDQVMGHAAVVESANDRPKMVGRLFDALKTTAQADKQLVREHFGNIDYESKNLTLQKSAELHGGETLTELVRRTCGRP